LTFLKVKDADFVFKACGAFRSDQLLVGADAGVDILREERFDLGEVILLFVADFGFDVGFDAEGAEEGVPKLFGFKVVGRVESALIGKGGGSQRTAG
jgi:hypothetical protein